MGFEAERSHLNAELERLQQELKSKTRRLEKISKIQDALIQEPAPGIVIRFSRPLGGSSRKYTFVLFRCGDEVKSWFVTGKPNTLNLLGLGSGGNTWDDVLVAIGDAKVKIATEWRAPDEALPEFRYYRSFLGNVYRVWTEEGSTRSEIRRSDGSWRGSIHSPLELSENSVTFQEISAAQAGA
jgi:hypothetical protein